MPSGPNSCRFRPAPRIQPRKPTNRGFGSEKKFYLRRAVEADLNALVELLANDPLRQTENSATLERRTAYLTVFRAINADPAQLLVVAVYEAEAVVATMQLTVIP